MQKQIIVPFATALIAQTAHAMSLQQNLNQTPSALGHLELAQQQQTDEQECRAKYDALKKERDLKCEKKNDQQKQRCLNNNQRWYNNQIINKCLPCDRKVLAKHERKVNNCHKKETEAARQKCRNNADKWRDRELEKCNPTCEGIAKKERQATIKECKKTFPRGKERNKCVNDANDKLKEDLELCKCRDGVYAEFAPKFEYCKGLADPNEAKACHEEVDGHFQEAYEYHCLPNCWEEADANYHEAAAKCEENDDAVEVEICLKDAKEIWLKHTEQCKLDDCISDMEEEMQPRFERCDGLETEAQRQACKKEVQADLEQMIQDHCHDEPEPNCWEEADANYHEAIAICDKNDDAVEIDICYKNAKEIWLKHTEECKLDDCISEMEEEMGPRFERCDGLETEAQRQACKEEVQADLEQMIQDHCHDEPEPDCWEDAAEYYEEILKKCDALDDMSADKQQCYDNAHEIFEKMNERCCVEEAHTTHKPEFEACEQNPDQVERDICNKKVKESLVQALEDCRPPEPTCWEQADANYHEAAAICEKNDDDVERDICYKNAKKDWMEHTERCKLDDCYAEAEAQMAPRFETCQGLETEAQRQACFEEAEADLKKLKEDNCHPEPNCWEEAMAWKYEHLEKCEMEWDKEACIKEVYQEFEAMNEQCRIEDCYEEQEAQLQGRFDWCNAMTDAVEKENCLAEINEVLDQMKQDNCHPEPDCWEEAMAWLNGHLKECENLDDPEKARDCMEKGHQRFEAMNEQCNLEECYDQQKASLEPVFETCESMETEAQRQACFAEAEAHLKQLIQDNCHPEPDCWEEAMNWKVEALQECETRADKEDCIASVYQKFEAKIENCNLEECYYQQKASLEPLFETCEGMETEAQRQACFAEAEAHLNQLVEDNCHPEPSCRDQARAVYDENRAVCDAMTDQTGKENCYKEAEEVYAESIQGCELQECEQKAHEYHDPMFEQCNAIDDPEQARACHAETDASLKKMLEECHPKPPTCYDEARNWYKEASQKCEDPLVDRESCLKEVKEHYANWINDCEIADCVDGVYTQFRPEYEYCETLTDEVEQRACVENVDKLVAEMLQMCYPQPPTCYEEAAEWLEEQLESCKATHNDAVEVETCQREAKERYTQWVNDCEMRECKERVRQELQPKFDACYENADPQECLDEVQSVYEQMLQEHCYPPPPTCHEQADAQLEEDLAGCGLADGTVDEVCSNSAYEKHRKWIEECNIGDCVDKVQNEHAQMIAECDAFTNSKDKRRCQIEADRWLEENLETCYPEPTCQEKARAEYQQREQSCLTLSEDPAEIDACMKEAKEDYAEQLELCECQERAHAEVEPKYQSCEMLTDVEKEICEAEIDELLKKLLEECSTPPPPPSCIQQAKEWYTSEVERCQTTMATPEDCIAEARATYEKMSARCEIAECYERAYAQVEDEYNCDDQPAALKDQCETEKAAALEELLAACNPQTPQVETACGLVDVDTRLDNFNQLQLDAHNEYRGRHNASALAYNHTIALAAQEYAEWMRDNNQFKHSDRDERDGQGENLYMGSYSDIATSIRATKKWYDEEPDYDYANPGESTGVIGHFTQVVWKSTCQIGCGEAGGYVVCRYAPPGNWMDWDGGYSQYIENVQSPLWFF